MAGETGSPDVLVQNIESVGDIRIVFQRVMDQNGYINVQVENLKRELETKVQVIERMVTLSLIHISEPTRPY